MEGWASARHIVLSGWIVFGAALISGFAVLSREAMSEFSFSAMEELLRKRNLTRDLLPRAERFAERLRDTRAMLRILDHLCRGIVATGTVLWTSMVFDEPAYIALVAAGIFLVFLAIVDFLVRPLAAAHSERLTLALLGPWVALYYCLWLPSLPFRGIAAFVERLGRGGEDETPQEQAEDDIMAAVSLSEYAGHIDEQERDMIEAVLGLGDLTVERIMTPRTELQAIEVGLGTAGAVSLAKATGHSRIPVYRENRDNIIGVCYAKDLVGLDVSSLPDLESILRPPTLVPAVKKVIDLLKELRRDRVHLAVVLDEYGGTAGVVTIEDIVEEVFGDIDDEYDHVEAEEARPDGDGWDLDARLKVDEVNERFDVNLPESDRYESIGGLITTQLGRIPTNDEVWDGTGVRLTILEATDRRIVRVRLERLATVEALSDG